MTFGPIVSGAAARVNSPFTKPLTPLRKGLSEALAFANASERNERTASLGSLATEGTKKLVPGDLTQVPACLPGNNKSARNIREGNGCTLPDITRHRSDFRSRGGTHPAHDGNRARPMFRHVLNIAWQAGPVSEGVAVRGQASFYLENERGGRD